MTREEKARLTLLLGGTAESKPTAKRKQRISTKRTKRKKLPTKKPAKRAPKGRGKPALADPAKKAEGMKAGTKPVHDWARAEAFFLSGLDITNREVAKEIGANENTVSRKRKELGWDEKRANLREELVQKGLEEALEKRREGMAALTHLEYQEAMAIITVLQAARRQATSVGADGKTVVLWTPSQIRTYALAFRETTGLARISLGLPTEISATPAEVEKLTEELFKDLTTDDLKKLREIAEKTKSGEG